jgi:hypothetical protein
MIPDAELLSLLCTILTRLEIGDFTIKVRSSDTSTVYLGPLAMVHRLIIGKSLMAYSRSAAYHRRRSALYRPLLIN